MNTIKENLEIVKCDFNKIQAENDKLKKQLHQANVQLLIVYNEITGWKIASGLKYGEDPDGVTSKAAQKYWNKIAEENLRLKEENRKLKEKIIHSADKVSEFTDLLKSINETNAVDHGNKT